MAGQLIIQRLETIDLQSWLAEHKLAVFVDEVRPGSFAASFVPAPGSHNVPLHLGTGGAPPFQPSGQHRLALVCLPSVAAAVTDFLRRSVATKIQPRAQDALKITVPHFSGIAEYLRAEGVEPEEEARAAQAHPRVAGLAQGELEMLERHFPGATERVLRASRERD